MEPWAAAKKLSISVAVPPAPVRVPSQRPLAPSVAYHIYNYSLVTHSNVSEYYFKLSSIKLHCILLQGRNICPRKRIIFKTWRSVKIDTKINRIHHK